MLMDLTYLYGSIEEMKQSYILRLTGRDNIQGSLTCFIVLYTIKNPSNSTLLNLLFNIYKQLSSYNPFNLYAIYWSLYIVSCKSQVSFNLLFSVLW